MNEEPRFSPHVYPTRLYVAVRKAGAKDVVRVTASIFIAQRAGVPLEDALDSLRKHQPHLFWR